MTSSVLCVVILLSSALKLGVSQTVSCKGRCGGEYYRGESCQCDYKCLTYRECCKDYESQCTTRDSCKGRCGETFKRGSLCSCDADCMKYKQCCSDYESHCAAEEPALTTTELSSAYSEGNQADDALLPQDSSTSQPTEEPGDDMYSNIIESDDFSNNDVENPEASQILESTNGYGFSTIDLLSQVSTEPTQGSRGVEVTPEMPEEVSKTESTVPDGTKPFTVQPTTSEVTTKSTDASDPEPTPPPVLDSIKPSSTSVSQVMPTKLAITSEGETVEQVETQSTQASFPLDEPEATSIPLSTQNSVTILEDSQVTTTPPSSTPDLTTIQEENTSNPNTDSNAEDVASHPTSLPADPEDPFTPVSAVASGIPTDLDAVTSHIISSTAVPQDVTTDSVTKTTVDPADITTKPTGSQKPEPRPQDKPDPTPQDKPEPTPQDKPDPTPQDKPGTKPELKPQDKPDPAKPVAAKPSMKPMPKPQDGAQTVNTDDPNNFQSDDSHDTNLCSGRPVSGVTTLRNGTIVVFRGHYFWILDRNRVPGPAQGITQVWGVPSPIDTVFTRCNCQGKTYIFKGGKYWRFENDVLDTSYPRAVQTGFDGLQGHITGALSVPQYQSRRESVYFFKRGGVVQKYSYQFGTSPSCGRKVQSAIYTVRNRRARQAVSVLGPTINIQTSWRGFPSTVTAAVSIPSSSEPEGYKYYIFSRTKSYQVRMNSGRPVVSSPTAGTSSQNDIFKCPRKV